MTNTPPARTRLAPSPTGRTHIGTARTALYDYLLARQTGGQFILRIEDTDQKRYVADAEAELMDGLRWLGLHWDEGPDIGGPHAPYRQTERRDLYRPIAEELIERGHAFYCFCTPADLSAMRERQQALKRPLIYDGPCRNLPPAEAKARVAAGEPHVIRFKMPREGHITVHDGMRGDITYRNADLDDYVIMKSDGLPTYHLAAMADDHLMGVTHVFRGSEWLPTFPLHVHIYRALGWQEPQWNHLSLFLKPSGKGKLSKRDSADMLNDGFSVFITDLRDLGYLPEGVLNWLALIGWSYDDSTEFFTLADLIEKFSLEKLNASPAALNFSKLDHFNGLHIRTLRTEDLATRLKPFFERAGLTPDDATLLKVAPLVQERIVTLDEAVEIAGFFFRDAVEPTVEDLIPKKQDAGETARLLRLAIERLDTLPDFNWETTQTAIAGLAEELGVGRGPFFQPLRVGVSGQRVSPPLFETMEILGREVSLSRLRHAADLLEQAATE